MDRFEAAYFSEYPAFLALSDLHSSMDRFEGLLGNSAKKNVRLIYIPVWIDLKTYSDKSGKFNLKIYIPVWIDLKPFHSVVQTQLCEIYIPVWIDLKRQHGCVYDFANAIYIPVWIDLKFQRKN